MSDFKKRVLIITYYWPPAGGPGVQRILKFVKYLGNYNWSSVIVTPRNASYPMRDESLSHDIPESTEVYKTGSIEPFLLYNLLQGKKSRSVPTGLIGIKDDPSFFQKLSMYIRGNLFIPDGRIGWNGFAFRQAEKIMAKGKIDAIITSGPPHSSHLVGHKLKKKYGVPWIADFRDPWTNVYYNKYFPRHKRSVRKDEEYERRVLSDADAVTTVSHGLELDLRRVAKNVIVIHNGFDEDDIYEGQLEKNEKFVMSHIGNFVPFLDSPGLWKAIRELCNEINGFEQDFHLTFIGKIDPFVMDNLKKSHVDHLVSAEKPVPHKEATKLMSNADLLLFSIANDVNNKLIISGKLFEYLASSTPIVSIGPTDGDAAKILSQTGRDPIFDYNDSEAIKGEIKKYYTYWKSNDHRAFKYSKDQLLKFTRKELTGILAKILDGISAKHNIQS